MRELLARCAVSQAQERSRLESDSLPAWQRHRIDSQASQPEAIKVGGQLRSAGAPDDDTPSYVGRARKTSITAVNMPPNKSNPRQFGGVKDSTSGSKGKSALEQAAADVAEEARLLAEAEAAIHLEEQAKLPPIEQDDCVAGWVFKRGGVKSKAFKKRYAVYVPASKLWTYYESDTHAMSDSKRKGQVKVTQAARVRALLSEPPPTKPPTNPPPCAWHNC